MRTMLQLDVINEITVDYKLICANNQPEMNKHKLEPRETGIHEAIIGIKILYVRDTGG